MTSMSATEQKRSYQRFALSDRIEHWVLFVSFTTLALTGLAQKFALTEAAQWFIAQLGGVETVRVIHRIAATLMAVETVYHLAVAGYRILVLRTRLSMLPGIQDARAAIQWLLYNLGLSKERPLEGRFTFAEKMEYWALIWGTIMMGFTGFILWNPIASARFLPGEVIPAAKAAHSAEALLAALAILIWHFYSVHLRIFNKSMFSGKLSEKEMAHEHPQELAEIKAGIAQRTAPPEAQARRRKIYIPVASALSLILLAGIVYFVTFEETALVTVDPIDSNVEAFVPLPPTPFPTPSASNLAEIGDTWDTGIDALVRQRCIACHNATLTEGGLDVSSLEALMAGGDNGVAIVPGDSSSGTFVESQITGDHPGQFSGEELALIREWIDNGALEN